MKSKHQVLALALVTVLGGSAHAAVSVNGGTFSYSQTFDSLAATGTANVWANDSTLAGWSLFNGADAVITYRAGTGSTNNGAYYSFGTDSDRALGGVGSGSLAGWIAVAFTNNTGAALDGFKLNFNGEQWRDGGNSTPVAQSMVLEYGFGNAFGNVTTWTAAGASFNWASPVFTTTAGAVNGNTAGRVANVGGTVTTNWGASQTLWIRWTEANNAGNDHGLAIDDVSFSVITAAVPEPGTYAMLMAGLACVGFVACRRKA